jgi:hypothetical protein
MPATAQRKEATTMDVHKALRELYEEKKRLDEAINALEIGLKAASRAPVRSRRGRKQMPAEERREVSKRMSAYWAAKRAQKAQAKPMSGSSHAGSSAQAAQEAATA